MTRPVIVVERDFARDLVTTILERAGHRDVAVVAAGTSSGVYSFARSVSLRGVRCCVLLEPFTHLEEGLRRLDEELVFSSHERETFRLRYLAPEATALVFVSLGLARHLDTSYGSNVDLAMTRYDPTAFLSTRLGPDWQKATLRAITPEYAREVVANSVLAGTLAHLREAA